MLFVLFRQKATPYSPRSICYSFCLAYIYIYTYYCDDSLAINDCNIAFCALINIRYNVDVKAFSFKNLLKKKATFIH
ncbi:hypothetical protein RB195_001477 [Necator americanus]|uniref:Uncharacterized protein n=1 Tax=Necator americanus TaxID=51031 RepID=A0ABR1DFW9_NECAM